MKIIDSNSLYKTLDNLNQRFLNNEQLTLKERTEVAHWISGRQGLKGTYAGMPAPSEIDFRGIKLFTGEYINSIASIGHILGEESLRALYLLNINDDRTNSVIKGFKSGLYKAIKKQYSLGRYAEGTFCCGKCTAALWRNLSAEGVKKNKQSLVAGIKYLKSLRDGKGKYKRFPFFYTILALSDINLPEAKAEIEYASDLLRRYVNRKGNDDIYGKRKKAVSIKALELIS